MFICLWLCSANIQAQQKKYIFTRYGKINGLAADMAFAVVQDMQGYIWIATDKGLQRYDGKHFINFQHNNADSTSIPPNGIGALHVDKKGRLWIIAFGNKLGTFSTSNFKYRPAKVLLPPEFRKNNLTRFKEDDAGILSLTIQNYGVLTYHEKNNEFAAVHNNIRLGNGEIPAEITETTQQGKYFITSRKGFDEYNNLTGQWTERNSNSLLVQINKALVEENAAGPAHIFTDKKGRIWGHMWLDGKKEAGPQVYRYTPAGNSCNTFKKSIDLASKGYHSINGFLEQRNGDIWLYGTNLFARFNEQKQEFEDVRNESLSIKGIEMEHIYNLFEDRDANIWISSSNGLFMFNPGRQVFSNLDNRRNDNKGVQKNSVDAVLQSQSGIIYASTWGAGIFAYDNNFNIVPNPIIPDNKTHAGFSGWDMHERKNGEIWIAMQGGSLNIYSPKTKKTINLKLSVFENKTVRQVTEDSSGNIWMGTQYGAIIKCTNANWKDTANAFKIVQQFNGRISKITADKKGYVWVCTDRFGIYKLNSSDGSIAAKYDDESPEGSRLQISGANDVLQYNDSIVLIASGGLNVLNTKTNKITFISTGKDNEHSSLASITRDRLGFIWLAFSDGLCRMELGKNIFLFFEEEDGILNNHFQINAAATLKDGRILLGTTTDLLVFDPGKISFPKRSVPVSISGFMAADKEMLVDSLLKLKKITLPYYNNTFTIDLSTFSYHSEYAIVYNMENLDNKWQFTSGNRVTYHRLPPGHYIFRAKSVSASGDESKEITTINITIVPPFWNTWWFYGLVVLSVIAVFYLIDRERLLRLKATQKLRTDIAINLHHDVNTALSNINLLSEMARMKADKDISRSKELIEQISDKSNEMMIAMDDMLWVIDPENDSMEKILMRMAEFTDSLRNRHEADIEIHIDEKVTNLKLDMKLRHGFFLIYKSALRCLVQFSGAKQTLVNIDHQKNILSLKIQADSILQSDSHILICMEDMKQHAADINAELDVQHDKNGSNIVLLIPVK